MTRRWSPTWPAVSQICSLICFPPTCEAPVVLEVTFSVWGPPCSYLDGELYYELYGRCNKVLSSDRDDARAELDADGVGRVGFEPALEEVPKEARLARLAQGESVIKFPSPLNVLKGVCEHSCY